MATAQWLHPSNFHSINSIVESNEVDQLNEVYQLNEQLNEGNHLIEARSAAASPFLGDLLSKLSGSSSSNNKYSESDYRVPNRKRTKGQGAIHKLR